MREHGQRSQEQLRRILCRCGHCTQLRIPTLANPTGTHPPSPPPPCAARVVEDKPSFPPPPRKPANTSLQLTSTPRETRVRTISKYHLGHGCDGTYDDSDFTASEMCCGCKRLHYCANTNHDLVDAAGNTCSSYLIDCDGRLDTSTFTAQELCCACGGGFQWLHHNPSALLQHLSVIRCQTDEDASCSQHNQNASTCGMYVCDDSLSLSFPDTDNLIKLFNKTGTTPQPSTPQQCVVRVVEGSNIFLWISFSE